MRDFVSDLDLVDGELVGFFYDARTDEFVLDATGIACEELLSLLPSDMHVRCHAG